MTNEDILDSVSGNKINSDVIVKLTKKVKEIEKKRENILIAFKDTK